MPMAMRSHCESKKDRTGSMKRQTADWRQRLQRAARQSRAPPRPKEDPLSRRLASSPAVLIPSWPLPDL